MTETDLSLYFANPITPDHKRYEALRALLFEKLPKIEVTKKFGYTEYTLQALVRDFRQGKLIFFHPKKPGPKERSSSKNCFAEKTKFIRRGYKREIVIWKYTNWFEYH